MSSSRLYAVDTGPTFGTVLKVADNIAEARAWAKRAFPGATVRAALNRRPACEWCGCRPCLCPKVQR